MDIKQFTQRVSLVNVCNEDEDLWMSGYQLMLNDILLCLLKHVLMIVFFSQQF